MDAKQPPSVELVCDMERYWSDGRFSDITVTYGERTWHLHPLILCNKSDYFEKACTSGQKESKDRHVTIEPIEGKTEEYIEQVPKSMYTNEYECGVLTAKRNPENDDDSDSDVPSSYIQVSYSVVNMDCFRVNIEMYFMADYFQIPALKKIAGQKWISSAAKLWEMWGIHEKSSKQVELNVIEPITQNMVQAMELAYGMRWNPRMKEMRAAIAASINDHMSTLMRRKDFNDMVRKLPALVGDVFLSQHDHLRMENGNLCPGCGEYELRNSKEGEYHVSQACKQCLSQDEFPL